MVTSSLTLLPPNPLYFLPFAHYLFLTIPQWGGSTPSSPLSGGSGFARIRSAGTVSFSAHEPANLCNILLHDGFSMHFKLCDILLHDGFFLHFEHVIVEMLPVFSMNIYVHFLIGRGMYILYKDVQSCQDEDVHVLWSILIDSHRHPALMKLKLWSLRPWHEQQNFRTTLCRD